MKRSTNRLAVITGLILFSCLLTFHTHAANRWSFNNGGAIEWSSIAPPSVSLWSYNNIGVIAWSSTDPGLGAPVDCGCTPADNDDVTITNTGLPVTLDALNGGSITVNASASLSIGNVDVCSTCSVSNYGSMTAGDVTVNNGGSFYVAPGASFSAANFENKNNSTGVTIDGGMTVTGTLINGNNAVIDGSGGITAGTVENNGGTIGGSLGNDVGTLPVELTSFEVAKTQAGLKLEWQTATELNNHYFDVERSEDGVNFYQIARMAGAGTTSAVQNYQYTDKAPIANVEYYRLKQVDFDGAFEYSKTIVGYADQLASALQMTAYPNPAAERVAIKSVRPVEFAEIKLINIAGQTVANLAEKVQGFGLNLEVALPVLEKGLYYIKYQTIDGQTGTHKLLIK